MEDYKPFKIVSVYRDGKSIGIDSAYDAAVYLLEHWPDVSGPKLETAKVILLKCLAGECSAAAAERWGRSGGSGKQRDEVERNKMKKFYDISGEEYEIDLQQKSDGSWVAVGDWNGRRIEVERTTESDAKIAWREEATGDK